ncbi:MAG: LacI family DNA-binding transcriptional regulator [Sedimentisphaerales bacterium]
MPKKSSTTVVEMANILGVAHTTVSRALADSPLISETTKRRVKELAAKMDYTKNPFANSLRTGKTYIVELRYFTVAEHLYQDPTLLTVMDVCQRELENEKYQLMLRIIRDGKKQGDVKLERHVADGYILVCGKKLPTNYREEFDKSSCVVMDNIMPTFSAINFDIDYSLRVLIEWLLSKGRKNVVALIQNPKGRYSLEHRTKSYFKICSEYHNYLNNLGIVTVDDGTNPFEELRKFKQKPDSVVYLNHSSNLMFYADRENIKIPEDLQIVAILDHEVESYMGKIPRIILDWSELACQSVVTLLALLKSDAIAPARKLVKSQMLE